MNQPESEYTKIAKYSLEYYLENGRKAPIPEDAPNEMLDNRAGVFVSLKKFGALRGCIGTIVATRDNIAEEIISNAVSAGVADPRFPPVTKDELPDLVYSVDILGEAEQISGLSELDVEKYGVIVTSGNRRGLLLPNLEGVDTVEEQVAIALHKAGIPAGDKFTLERFKVVRYK